MLSQQLVGSERGSGVNWFAGTRLITPAAVAAARSLTANLARLCPHSHRVLRLSGIHCCYCCCDCFCCDCYCCCCCGKCSCLAGNHLHFSLLPEAKCQFQVVYVGGVQLWLHLFLFLLFIIQLCARMQCVPVPLCVCEFISQQLSHFEGASCSCCVCSVRVLALVAWWAAVCQIHFISNSHTHTPIYVYIYIYTGSELHL